jgi:hypothetical protein
MWIALVVRHVNITAHHLLLACPPRVLRAKTSHGPKQSTPTLVKGGPGSNLSCGRFAIFWQANLLLSKIRLSGLRLQ